MSSTPDPARPGSVTVVGRGVSSVEPDILRVALAVEVTAATPAAALDACAAALERVRGAVLANDVGPAALQTSGVALQQEWDHRGNEPRPTGFAARIGLSVRLDAADRLGAVLSAAVQAGGDTSRVAGVRWDIRDRREAEASARAAAFADARRRAEQYAALAGRSLGAVLQVTEQPGWGPEPGPVRYAAASLAAMDTDPGEVDVAATVAVAWELG